MKSPLLLLALLALVTSLLAFRIQQHYSTSSVTSKIQPARPVIRCSPDWNSLEAWLEETAIPPLPGAGSYKWDISSRNDSARFYFNQGINTYYSFHIIESMASFKKAARFDPDCAILHWAQALAYGPNINDMGYAASPEALKAIETAVKLSASASPLEKGLIDAMQVRYTADSADKNRKQLNADYTAKMEALFTRFPNQADVAVLYADAMMLEHPWELWNVNGTPKSWTPRIRNVLEKALSLSPDNPGANHYYIHVMEPSPFAAKALPSANRLGLLTPGLSHTVHMPSHIYLRTGDYNKGVQVNENAVSRYKETIPLFAPVTGADFLYIIHNQHMQVNNAMMGGRGAYADSVAAELVKNIPADYLSFPGALGNVIQYINMTPVLVDIRFGNWQKILATNEPATGQVYARLLWQFGQGMALARLNQPGKAKEKLREIEELAEDSVLKIPFSPFSPAVDGAVIAGKLLEGTIAEQENRLNDAVLAYEKAVTTEAAMVYNEPRDWLLNPRHYLAAVLLKAGRHKEAENVLKDDLSVNNENGWSLYGLWQLYSATGKKAEAAKMLARYKNAFNKADCNLRSMVF